MRLFKRYLLLLPLLALPLAGCNDALTSVSNKVEHPLPAKLVNKMKAADMSTRSPVFMRIFKEENVLEVWKQKGNGRYDKIAEYEICKWSGKLGPKFKEGDRQAPEGYYRIYPAQMNPNSSYYLSFNTGYPNGFDRAHGRTGSNLMVHGACSSAGCYSMTDEQVLEIYAFAREAFRGGQPYFLVEALPFRMTPENMARHRNSEHFEFWSMLKEGYDHFELTKRPPQVEICERKYVFNRTPVDPAARFSPTAACPESEVPATLVSAHAAYEKKWQDDFIKAVARLDKEDARKLAAEESRKEAEARRLAAAEERERKAAEAAANGTAAPAGGPIGSLFSAIKPGTGPAATAAETPVDPAAPSIAAVPAARPDAPAPEAVTAVPPAPATATPESTGADAAVPVPSPNPETAPPAETAEEPRKPFWKRWGAGA